MSRRQQYGVCDTSGLEPGVDVTSPTSNPLAALFAFLALIATGLAVVNGLTLVSGFGPDNAHFEASATLTEVALWGALALCLWLKALAGASFWSSLLSIAVLALVVGLVGWMFFASMSEGALELWACLKMPELCESESGTRP